MNEEASNRIWDLFFLQGSKVLFRISLGLMHMMQNELLNMSDFGEIF